MLVATRLFRVNRVKLLEEYDYPAHVEQCLGGRDARVIAVSDYIRRFADQILTFVLGQYAVLGTGGYGLSDNRKQLRNDFEVDRRFIAVATLKALADQDHATMKTVSSAIRKYQIDPERPDPASR